jgi:hypothetical protein
MSKMQACCVALLAVLAAAPCYAADPAANENPTKVEDLPQWLLSLRTYFSVISDKRWPVPPGVGENSKSFALTQFGGTVSYRPAGSETFFDITAFAGSAGGIGYQAVDSFGTVYAGQMQVHRYDFEALAKTPVVPHSAALLVYGVRYVYESSSIPGIDSNGLPFLYRESTNYLFGVSGVSFWYDIDSAQRHSVYAGLTAGPGYKFSRDTNLCCGGLLDTSDARSGVVAGIAGHVGYAYSLTPTMQISARVRFDFISGAGPSFAKESTSIAGLEINLTKKW